MLKNLRDRILTELLLAGVTAGIYVEDLADGEILSINPDMIFPSASLIKVPIAAYLLKMAERGDLRLGDTVVMDLSSPEFDQPDGSGLLKHLTSKLALNLRDLMTLMLILSDNLATNELLKLTDLSAMNGALREFGLERTKVTVALHDFVLLREKTSNPTTPRDMSLLFKKLHHRELPLSDMLLELLAQQKINDRIPFFLPEFDDELKIPHKTGTLHCYAHDGGLVLRPEFGYTVSILTEHGTTWRNAYLTIARISELIYAHMCRKYAVFS